MFNWICQSFTENLRKRFKGIFELIYNPDNDDLSHPYYDDCFLLASFCDPNFKSYWIDKLNPLEYSDELKNNLKAYITNQAKKDCFDYSRKLQVEENRGS